MKDAYSEKLLLEKFKKFLQRLCNFNFTASFTEVKSIYFD